MTDTALDGQTVFTAQTSPDCSNSPDSPKSRTADSISGVQKRANEGPDWSGIIRHGDLSVVIHPAGRGATDPQSTDKIPVVVTVKSSVSQSPLPPALSGRILESSRFRIV